MSFPFLLFQIALKYNQNAAKMSIFSVFKYLIVLISRKKGFKYQTWLTKNHLPAIVPTLRHIIANLFLSSTVFSSALRKVIVILILALDRQH